MDITSSTKQLLGGRENLERLPDELIEIIGRGDNTQYLNTLSQLALNLKHTAFIFASHESISHEICNRWLALPDIDNLRALASLASLLPSVPYLSVYASALLTRGHNLLGTLKCQKAAALQDVPTEDLETLLLTLYRLLRFDNNTYSLTIFPAQIQVLLHSSCPKFKYLAIRILCLYIPASDRVLESMIQTYLPETEIPGQWDDKQIDYRFLSLWEDERLKRLEQTFRRSRDVCVADGLGGNGWTGQRVIEVKDFSATVACISGVLLPKIDQKISTRSIFVTTKTTDKNMRLLAEGVRSSKPLLVTGPSSAGKTLAIRQIAHYMGKSSSMVTLHLNEQTDAKLLIGTYASAESSSTFTWRPGILTKAVMEGRWVLIEDLNRAPMEITCTLLPLLERGELFIPNRGHCINAAPGFKLIATARSLLNRQGKEAIPLAGMIGLRHWHQIAFEVPPDEELAEIALIRFPLLHAHLPDFMKVYQVLSNTTEHHTGLRALGSLDLFKWCSRVQDLLSVSGVIDGNEPVSDAINDDIFLEAVDCFLGAYAPSSQKTRGVEIIAQELRMPAERAQYCLHARNPDYHASDSTLRVGRTILHRRKKSLRGTHSAHYSKNAPFTRTKHVLRVLESLAVAVKQAEPCLLVGETGTGKTTLVQRLADSLGRKLTVVNLSQQSEAGDLLGGYKPVNLRSLAIPLQEEFSDLLGVTFPSKQNQHYMEVLGKSITKGRWSRALLLWQEALRTIEKHLQPVPDIPGPAAEEPHSKRRKLHSSKRPELKSRWNNLASELQNFQRHLSSGSKGFAFSFVEGNIVKAARNGEWVLLDEINLASPDTLESLADLFSHANDNNPSILLTDSGDTERIYAAKDFRIFGAMNPATDIGKRNLPIGLRSRFTEIYVEASDKYLENLVAIAKSYLGSYDNIDVRAATDIANLHLEIKRLADQNRLVDGANQKPHFSLRTLTRTLIYVSDIAPIYGLRRGLFEGFSMSYLTILDRDSEQLLQPLIDTYILGGQKNSKAILRQTPRLPVDGNRYVQFEHYWIAQGAFLVAVQTHYIITPFIRRNLCNLIRATSTRRFPVLLQGPTSSGKTSMVEHLARISGNKFVRINNHEHTDLQEYLGSYVSGPDGQLQFQEGVLVQALREGYWVVLDELNLAPTDVLEALNRLLDDNRELLIPETQQVVKPHQNFMLFATQNPPGMYGGRKVLSRAFRNRFLELHFDDIPEDELETILRERSQIAPSFCKNIVAVYQKLSILRQSERIFEQKNSFVTLRDLFRWALRDADTREQLAVNGFVLLAERVRNQDERSAVKRVIEEVMRVKIDEDTLYGPACVEKTLKPSMPNIVWTKSMRRLHVLVTEALKTNEPILLVGETGSGKTTICQFVANEQQSDLHIINAHQNMETSDLIGGQRPVRNKAQAGVRLVEELTLLLKENNAYENDYGSDLRLLLEAYEALRRSAPLSMSDEHCLHIQELRTTTNALFEWTDGSLVNAMRNGQQFLLDEISLADDSVLERLNSVLEPDRSLFLAEKGSNDALITAAPGFQFLATMNPGGDYGKRELSPALRNRFTEIWVPNTSSEDEMSEIVQATLKPTFNHFCGPMVKFAAWYASRYNVNAPFISIRDLLSWIQFVNESQISDYHARLLHGAAVVYLDGLGANPSSKVSFAEDVVLHERDACLTQINNLFGHDLSSHYTNGFRLSNSTTNFEIGPFSIPKASSAAESSKYSLQAPTAVANALKIIRALQLQRPILLEGSPGVGKTTLVAALAQEIGMPLTRINLSDQTDLMDLFGSDVPIEGGAAGQFGWRDAPFLRAMQNGEWVLLDEMNLASQSILEGLNSCFDHRGSVYVSEINQTFQKHPKFVVFAAQNPHHQGGGRKGLPASFVNRFTIVYADAFQPEDLMIISDEMYPSIAHETREQLVDAVTALNHLVHQDRRVVATGGPWEINLRDILRWLHLLAAQDGLMPFAKPADYCNMLFLQRFRTREDCLEVSRLLQRSFPQDQARNIFYGKSERLIEIGLGILPRDDKKQSKSSLALTMGKFDLSIAESLVLCVQNHWPCLLVGTSGSGKSNQVLQLAAVVGREVLTLSLSPEIDTMDLIGGYEQVDPNRKIVAFAQRLKEHIHDSLISTLQSGNGPDESLVVLDTKLQNGIVTPEELLPDICNAAERDPQSRLNTFKVECKSIIQRSNVDNRACFGWIDGALVKALKEGKWLILDNANLCNASVLDRLNSLLEPDGFLSIHEHCNPDGSAQTVKPHRNFQVFMTMDPRYGELSRAMRNRLIEIFVPPHSPCPRVKILDPSIEPNVANFTLFQAFDWNHYDDASSGRILRVCFDHLTFPNFQLYPQWESQMLKGLESFSVSQASLFASILNGYTWMLNSKSSILRAIRSTYQEIETELITSPGFSCLQTLHPFNHSLLFSSTDLNPPLRNLRWLGTCFELLSQVYEYVEKVDQSKESSMPIFQDVSRPLKNFFADMGICLKRVLDSEELQNEPDGQKTISLAQNILDFLEDMIDLTNSKSFDGAMLQVFQTLGACLYADYEIIHIPNRVASRLVVEFRSRLNTMNDSWQLNSGLGMENLWKAFRPATAKDWTSLNLSLHLKKQAVQFEALKWRSGASTQELIHVHESMVKMHIDSTSARVTGSALSELIQKALDDLENQSCSPVESASPYFRSQFGMLYQYEDYGKDFESDDLDARLTLLSGTPTIALMVCGQSSNAWSTLARLKRITAIGHADTELAAARNVSLLSVLKKLEGINEVPLQALKLLRLEIDTIAESICRSPKTIIRKPLGDLARLLRTLQTEVQESVDFQVLSDKDNLCHLQQLLRQFGSRAEGKGRVEARVQYLRLCLQSTADSQIWNTDWASGHDPEAYANAASGYILFFVGCLLLYTPNRPFDPALRPIVERLRHENRRQKLETKLQALRDFEVAYSGQNESFRTHLAEQKFEALGAEPAIPSIIRPETSELGHLQAEFNTIFSTILLKMPDSVTTKLVTDGQAVDVQGAELLRSNIAQVIARLTEKFHAYEDITKPLVAMLQGLDVGLTLSLIAGCPIGPPERAIQYLCAKTPLLGADGASLKTAPLHAFNSIPANISDPRVHSLNCVALECDIDQKLEEHTVQTMLRAFHELYQEWKDQLVHDQEKNTLKSSLYRYRGLKDSDDGLQEEEMAQLFPNYDSTTEDVKKSASHQRNPRDSVQQIACLHREIFQSSGNPSQRILHLLRDTSIEIAKLWPGHSSKDVSRTPTENLLSGLVLSLDENKSRLLGTDTEVELYNFYTDAKLTEAQKLISLVHRIQERFTELQQAWPEHATLAHVRRTSSELLAMRHTEPIAKLLTKTEQLQGYVYEWQRDASREYTAATLFDQLTDLLISWRRLELLTWKRLLDMEDQQCHEDADTWWFLAYEAIVAAPLSIGDKRDELRVHAEQLFATLSDFMSTTSTGQYMHRIKMIECFKDHLEYIIKEYPSMNIVKNAITNLLRYYTHFAAPVQEQLDKGRRALGKDMEDIIEFASVKERNIEAIRSSTKRSHHKLFKVIRKYRALLAQPAETILAQGLPDGRHLGDKENYTNTLPQILSVDPHALQICQQHISNWQTKAERFTNPIMTATRILRMGQPNTEKLDGPSYLEFFTIDLQDSIKTLQAATPSKATEDNVAALKHLKSRKRKLYTDTLKSLRQMGFRSNMSAEALTKQGSTPMILTNSLALEGGLGGTDLDASEYHFHKLLSVLPQAKERSRAHSQDLTPGEIARSLGYLESMVAMIIRQRGVIANAMSELDVFHRTKDKMQVLCNQNSYSTLKQNGSEASRQSEVHRTLRWLHAILGAGSVVVEKCGKLGGADNVTILAQFSQWKSSTEASIEAIADLPGLPAGLISSQHDRVVGDANLVLQDIHTQSKRLADLEPNVGFILNQIQNWTVVQNTANGYQVNGEHPLDLEEIDVSISSAFDIILVAMQETQDVWTALPSSEEDAKWLLRIDESLAQSRKSFHSHEINSRLERAMSRIQDLDSSNGAGLEAAKAVCVMAMPVVQQFCNVQQMTLKRHLRLHRSLCSLASLLAQSFCQIAQEGFCGPTENSAEDGEKNEKLEGGTGLGEGEGAEDTSKDIQDDEDLSELAQQNTKDKEKEEIKDQEDAVDMDHDELEGEMGESSEKGEDDGSASEHDENDIDEEIGDVDALDPTAVDEKLWDGKAEDSDKEKQGTKGKGQAERDEQAATDPKAHQEESPDESVGEDEADADDKEESAEIAKQEAEEVAPHTQEGQVLDLPEEMDLDNMDDGKSGSGSGDSDMDGMSDIASEERADPAEQDNADDASDKEMEVPESQPEQPGEEVELTQFAESPVDTDPSDDDQEIDQALLPETSDGTAVEPNDAVPSDTRGLANDMDHEQQDADEAQKSQNQASKQDKGGSSNEDDAQAAAEIGQMGPSNDKADQGQAQDDFSKDSNASPAFKRLGDALEKWHRQNKEIIEASEQDTSAQPEAMDTDMVDKEFEHLHDEAEDSSAQALGAATAEQARALDEKASDAEIRGETSDFPPDSIEEEGAGDQDESMDDVDPTVGDAKERLEQHRPGILVANKPDESRSTEQPSLGENQHEEDIGILDNDLSVTHIQAPEDPPSRSAEEARRLWSHYESLTRDLSLSLTEQLRLILAPTLATKMRGDFRTGKRLNIKRIIPYIASQYKRDKIWMRRSVPSKRDYQIMLAVDDSKSMGESGSGQLAFETLALVAKSLSMLEVGQICIVGFGNEVHVAHDFDKPFSSEAGAQIFQHFGFRQRKTNIRKLVADSITLFREANRKSFNAGTDLWQLELIISDGLCEDHDVIRRLVRQAQEEHIMIIFVIVDALLKEESIVDMSQAVFEEDEDGSSKLKIKRYLDGFPFPYYLVVSDVKELPNVLAQALRQWFAEVVESG